MAFCSHCGEPAQDDAAFCTTCGTSIHEEAPSPAPAAPSAADQSPASAPPSSTPPPGVPSPPSSPPPTAAPDVAASPSTGKRPLLIGSVAAAVVGVVAVAAWFGLQQSSSADSGGVAIVAATTTTAEVGASATAPTTTRPATATSTSTTLPPTTTTLPPTTTTLPADLISSLQTTAVFVEPGSSADPSDLQETVRRAREQGFGLSVVAVAAEPEVGLSPYAETIATSLNAETVVVVGPSGLGWASQEPDFYQEEFERAWNRIPPGSSENAAVASFVRSVLGGPDSVGVMGFASADWLLLRFDGTPTEFTFGDTDDLPAVGDWDCDGIQTPGVWRHSTNEYFLRNSINSGEVEWTFRLDQSGYWPLAGDFDGDTCGTQAFYSLLDSTVYIFSAWGEDGADRVDADVHYQFGDEGDIPFVGDFDGDGIDTVGLFRPSTGMFYLKNTHTEGPADIEFAFGANGDIPVAGDWGVEDGIDTVAVYRPSTGTFFFRYENSPGPADETLEFGILDGYPVAGAFGLERSD